MLRVNQARRFNVFSQNKLQNELVMAMVQPITRQEWNSFIVVFFPHHTRAARSLTFPRLEADCAHVRSEVQCADSVRLRT